LVLAPHCSTFSRKCALSDGLIIHISFQIIFFMSPQSTIRIGILSFLMIDLSTCLHCPLGNEKFSPLRPPLKNPTNFFESYRGQEIKASACTIKASACNGACKSLQKDSYQAAWSAEAQDDGINENLIDDDGLARQGHGPQRLLRLKGGGLWSGRSGIRQLPSSGIPITLKLVVSACGGAWCFGSISGLVTIFGIVLSPGGLDFLIDNYGLLIPFLFVAFHSVLAAVQLQKLISVFRASSLSSIRWTLICQVSWILRISNTTGIFLILCENLCIATHYAALTHRRAAHRASSTSILSARAAVCRPASPI
jgi:hypothetical protein